MDNLANKTDEELEAIIRRAENTDVPKLYSKYTDILLAMAFNHLGIKSAVVKQRSDSADVDGSGPRRVR